MTITDDDPLAPILRKDPRYPRAAYEFVHEALRHAIEKAGEARHVTARELLDNIREFGRAEFGPLARTVFASWNVDATSDFGNIVFNLVEADQMGKTDEDDIADFDGVYDLAEAFPADPGTVEVRRPSEDDE